MVMTHPQDPSDVRTYINSLGEINGTAGVTIKLPFYYWDHFVSVLVEHKNTVLKKILVMWCVF